MNCNYCGTKIFDTDRRCVACGAPIAIPLNSQNHIITGEWNASEMPVKNNYVVYKRNENYTDITEKNNSVCERLITDSKGNIKPTYVPIDEIITCSTNDGGLFPSKYDKKECVIKTKYPKDTMIIILYHKQDEIKNDFVR